MLVVTGWDLTNEIENLKQVNQKSVDLTVGGNPVCSD